LPYTGFTFDSPERQSYILLYIIYICACTVSLSKHPNVILIYILYISAPVQFLQDQILYRYFIERRVSRLRNFLLTGTLSHTGFTFDLPGSPSYIYNTCKSEGPFVIPTTTILFYKYKIYISTVASRDCVDSLLTGILPYTGFTFAAPEHQSYIDIYRKYIAALINKIDSLFDIYQLRFFSFAHFLPELIYYPSPKLIFKAQPKFFFGTIRYMQPVSALSPSFFSSSS
jgi:hypothetical protein